MCKNYFVGCFQEENWSFNLYELNEGVVTNIFKMKDLFGMIFSRFMCMTLLFCDYEKKVGTKIILYDCCSTFEVIIKGNSVH